MAGSAYQLLLLPTLNLSKTFQAGTLPMPAYEVLELFSVSLLCAHCVKWCFDCAIFLHAKL